MCVKEFHNKFKCAYVHHAISFVAFCRCIVLILLYTGAFTGSATQDITSSAPKVSFVCVHVCVCVGVCVSCECGCNQASFIAH